MPVSNETYATLFPSGDHDGDIIGSELDNKIFSLAPSESASMSL